MRKALIVKEPFMGREVGDIFQVGSASEIDAVNNRFVPRMEKIAMPDSWDSFPLKVDILSEGETLTEYWFKGDEIVMVEPTVTAWEHNTIANTVVYEEPAPEDAGFYSEVTVMDPEFTHVPEGQEGINLRIDWTAYFNGLIQTAKNAMNQDIYNAVSTYFGTSDREAASAWASSWQIKRDNAAAYENDGLVVMLTTSSFSTVGEALDSEAKIQSHFSELVTERVIPFDKLRDQEVTNFVVFRAQIDAKIAEVASL